MNITNGPSPPASEIGLTATGNSQPGAFPLNPQYVIHVFSTVPAGSGAVLMPCSGSPALTETIYNNGANALALYPAPGQQIGALGPNNPLLILPSAQATLTCIGPGQWTHAPFMVGVDPILVGACPDGAPGVCISFDPNATLSNPLASTGTNVLGTNSVNNAALSPLPTLTFEIPGDLSVTYTTQVGSYSKLGSIISLTIALSGTLTYTTAASDMQITGLPYVPFAVSGQHLTVSGMSGFTWPASSASPMAFLNSSNTTVNIGSLRASSSTSNWTTSALLSGTTFLIWIDGCYRTAS